MKFTNKWAANNKCGKFQLIKYNQNQFESMIYWIYIELVAPCGIDNDQELN